MTTWQASTRLHGRARAARQLLWQRPAAARGLAHMRLQRACNHRKCCRGDDLRQRRLSQRMLRSASDTSTLGTYRYNQTLQAQLCPTASTCACAAVASSIVYCQAASINNVQHSAKLSSHQLCLSCNMLMMISSHREGAQAFQGAHLQPLGQEDQLLVHGGVRSRAGFAVFLQRALQLRRRIAL